MTGWSMENNFLSWFGSMEEPSESVDQIRLVEFQSETTNLYLGRGFATEESGFLIDQHVVLVSINYRCLILCWLGLLDFIPFNWLEYDGLMVNSQTWPIWVLLSWCQLYFWKSGIVHLFWSQTAYMLMIWYEREIMIWEIRNVLRHCYTHATTKCFSGHYVKTFHRRVWGTRLLLCNGFRNTSTSLAGTLPRSGG